MKLSAEGFALIQQFEGLRTALYSDAAGLPTIGYGHWVPRQEIAIFRDGISAEQALALLQQDITRIETAVMRWIEVSLTPHQFDALVSFTFNLGSATLQRSTLRRVINQGDYKAAPAQFLRYSYAGGRKWPGLLRRRQAEAGLFEE